MERSASLISPAFRKLATRLWHVAQTVLQAGLYASLLHQGNNTNRSKAFSAYSFANIQGFEGVQSRLLTTLYYSYFYLVRLLM